MSLTKRERDCLGALDRLTVDGVCPAMSEVAAALGLASKSGIHRLYTALEKRGYITQMKHTCRGVDLTAKALVLLGKRQPAKISVSDLEAAPLDQLDNLIATATAIRARRTIAVAA